jgi:phage baseplate assembly protein V
MIRGIVKSVVEGAIKRFSASGRADETIDNREYFQHYGYTSRPLAGAEIIIIREGGHFVAVASDDRRYRLSLENGEVALYDDQGQKVHLKRDKTIEISGCDTLVATVGISATVTSPTVTVVASTKVTLQTPLVECTQDLKVDGDIVAAGDISDANGTKSMSGMRQIHGVHTHPHPADGVPIPAPNEAM